MKRSREPEEDIDSGFQYGDTAERFPTWDISNQPTAKISQLDVAGLRDEDDTTNLRCSLPPHTKPIEFTSYQQYESHYIMFHTNRCLECRKNFPSEHLLGVHIEECHDPLVRVRRDKGEHTYSCFVEGCERKCLTHQKRRLHMIDKHMYPKNFFFAVTKEGIDGRRSLLVESGHRRRRSSTNSVSKDTRRRARTLEGQEIGAECDREVSSDNVTEKAPKKHAGDSDMADLTGAMSALQFVPPSVRFGRGRAGFSKT